MTPPNAPIQVLRGTAKFNDCSAFESPSGWYFTCHADDSTGGPYATERECLLAAIWGDVII